MNAVRVARSPEPGTDKYVPVWSYGANHTITQTRQPKTWGGAGPTYANSAWFLHVQEPSMANRIEFIKARSIITSTASNARHVSVFSSLEKNKPVACDLPGGMHLQATSYSVRRQVAPAGRANIDPLDHLIDHVRHQEGAGVIPSLGLHLSDVIDDQFNRQFNSCTGTTPVQHHACMH